MADKRLRTMVFPGLEDTYTIPQDMNDLESIDAVSEPYDEFASYSIGDYCSNGGKLYRCNTAIPSGETWNANHWTETNVGDEILAEKAATSTALNGKVSKAGDTMTGDLQTKSGNIEINEASNAWGNASVYLNDKNSTRMASIRAFHFTNGMGGIQIGGHNGSVENILRLMVNSGGERSVGVSDSSAWRTALGLTYAANDTYSSGTTIISGIVTNNAKRLLFIATVDKSLGNISTVTVTDLHGHTAGVAGVIDGNASASDDLKNKSGYTVTAAKINNNTVRIQIDKSTALTNASTATPFTIYGYFTLKFT